MTQTKHTRFGQSSMLSSVKMTIRLSTGDPESSTKKSPGMALFKFCLKLHLRLVMYHGLPRRTKYESSSGLSGNNGIQPLSCTLSCTAVGENATT